MNINILVKLNSFGFSQKEMQKILNCTRGQIQYHLKKLNLSTYNYHNAIKFNDHIFDKIDSEEKAYWLGFLYADGNVASKSNNIELSLSSKDISHLEKFNKFLNNSSKIKISKVKGKGKEYERCRIVITSKHLKNTLITLGCIPKKSCILTFPKETQVPKYLRKDFIRGYIDGDGCISFPKTKRLALSVIGTKEFLTDLLNIFPQFGKIRKDKRWKNNTFYLNCGYSPAEFIISKLYKNANIYLQRKYDRFAVLLSNQ